MPEVIVGIDLGIRAKHVAAICGLDGAISQKRERFAHTSDGLASLWKTIGKERRSSKDRVRVLLEPTGMSWFPVAQYFTRRGCEVTRVTGKQVQALRSYLSQHTKTDCVDAGVLAQIPSFGEMTAQPLRLPRAEELALKRCTKQRGRFAQQIADTMRRLKDLVRWAHPGLEKAFHGELTSATARAVLRTYFDPFVMRRLGKARLQSFLEAHGATNYPGIHGPHASLATALMAAACEAIALYESREVVDFEALQREIVRELDVFEMHRSYVRQLDAEIATFAQQTGMKHLVESLPGVADVLGGVLLAYAGDAHRFRNVSVFKAYCGVIPRVEQSAMSRSASAPLTKAGANPLKRALYLAADIARQTDPQLARIITARWWLNVAITPKRSARSQHNLRRGSMRFCGEGARTSCVTSTAARSALPRDASSSSSSFKCRTRSARRDGALSTILQIQKERRRDRSRANPLQRRHPRASMTRHRRPVNQREKT